MAKAFVESTLIFEECQKFDIKGTLSRTYKVIHFDDHLTQETMWGLDEFYTDGIIVHSNLWDNDQVKKRFRSIGIFPKYFTRYYTPEDAETKKFDIEINKTDKKTKISFRFDSAEDRRLRVLRVADVTPYPSPLNLKKGDIVFKIKYQNDASKEVDPVIFSNEQAFYKHITTNENVILSIIRIIDPNKPEESDLQIETDLKGLEEKCDLLSSIDFSMDSDTNLLDKIYNYISNFPLGQLILNYYILFSIFSIFSLFSLLIYLYLDEIINLTSDSLEKFAEYGFSFFSHFLSFLI